MRGAGWRSENGIPETVEGGRRRDRRDRSVPFHRRGQGDAEPASPFVQADMGLSGPFEEAREVEIHAEQDREFVGLGQGLPTQPIRIVEAVGEARGEIHR